MPSRPAPETPRTLFLACLLALRLFGQTPQASIRVEVTSDRAPIASAEVKLNGETALTDTTGVAFGAAPSGSLRIAVVKDGFLPASTTLDITSEQAAAFTTLLVQVELRPAEPIEEEITVSTTRNGARLQDLPLRVEVLTQEEIEEKMMMTPGDIVMMLNEMGGMRVQTTSPSLGAASVRMQGMRGRYTRFLSDGLPLFGQQGAGLGLLQIPPMDLGQVEVIKGNASALYGAAAMAGVVNLLSRRPSSEPIREFLFNRTTLGGTDVSSFLGSRLPANWGFTFLAGGHFQQSKDRDGDAWADLAGYRRGLARPRFYYDNGRGSTALVTSGFLYEARSGGTLPGRVLAATGEPYREALDTSRYDLGIQAQTLLAHRYVLATRFSASFQKHLHRFGEVTERDRHELFFGEVSLRGATGRHTWVAGAAGERDAYRPNDVSRFAYTYVTPGIFVQDDVVLAPWLSGSASARADFHNQFGVFFSPRVSALLRHGGWTSRISAGQGFFAPTPLTEETEAAGLTRLTVLEPLRAERGKSASIDLTRAVGSLSLTTTFFASNVGNPISADRGAAYRLSNLAQPTTNRGAEFLSTLRRERFSATASYTYVRSRELDPSTSTRADLPLTPRHSLGLVGVWEQKGKGRLGLEAYYTGRQRLEYDPNREYSKAYWIFGIMGERKVHSHFSLFLNLENLANVRQTRWNSLLRPTRGADGRWTVDAWAPLAGRVINGGVRFHF
jgi:iron complex outermembrane receptor protein